MKDSKVNVVILAAGMGKRMKSSTPKVMHKIGSAPILEHILKKFQNYNIIVVASKTLSENSEFQKLKTTYNFKTTIQHEQNGTGGAVKAAVDSGLLTQAKTLILCGDAPFVTQDSIDEMMEYEKCILVFKSDDPTGYGRIVTGPKNSVIKIVEEKDCSDKQKLIEECNSGVMMLPTHLLKQSIGKLKNNNAAKEYYLTDMVSMLSGFNYVLSEEFESLGINSMQDLSIAEQVFQSLKREEFLDEGVTLIDPESIYFAIDTKISNNVVIYPHCFFGRNVTIRANSTILPFCMLEDTEVSESCSIGPFARLRANTKISEDVRVGNFVEVKNSAIGKNSKMSHLSYIGDVEMGEKCNIGAGTVFCNFDGKKKHKSTVKNGVFVGSNTSIISPITIGENSLIAAGSTITEDVDNNSLAIARAKQVNKKRNV